MDIKRLVSAIVSLLILIALVLFWGFHIMQDGVNDGTVQTSDNSVSNVDADPIKSLDSVVEAIPESETGDIKSINRDKDKINELDADAKRQEEDLRGTYKGNEEVVVPGFTGVFGEVVSDLDDEDDAEVIYMGIASAERDELWKAGKLNEDGTLKEELTSELINEYDIEIDEGVEHSIGKVGVWGIDVSKYNKEIDWKQVKAAGVDYAIIRCGYRGASTGNLVLDPYWESNINGAIDAGMKVGVYFFTQAITEAEAVEEANLALALTDGINLDYPIFIDVEGYPGRASGLDAGTRTSIVNAFLNAVLERGAEAGVYANKNWFTNHLFPEQFPDNTIKWLAQYNVTEPSYKGKYHMWQYSSKGSVPGISGYVDVNQSYLK